VSVREGTARFFGYYGSRVTLHRRPAAVNGENSFADSGMSVKTARRISRAGVAARVERPNAARMAVASAARRRRILSGRSIRLASIAEYQRLVPDAGRLAERAAP